MPKKYTKYDEDFKKSIVELYNNGKSQAFLIREYNISQTAISSWIKKYSSIQLNSGEVITAEQIKSLQKRNALLEEENLILKKAIAIFTQHSNKD